jgi:ketopantoate reductase
LAMAVRKKAKEETERMLQDLAAKGHLEVTVENGRLHYALWDRDAPL